MSSMKPSVPRGGALGLASCLLALASVVAAPPAAAAAEAPGAAPRYRLEVLHRSTPGSTALVTALNNRGEVAFNTSGSGGSAFVWSRGHATDWGDRFDQITDLSDRGDVLGYAGRYDQSSVWRDGRMTPLPGKLEQISPNGQWLAGMAQTRAAVSDGTRLWFSEPLSEEIQSYATDVNDHGVAVGISIYDRNGPDGAILFDRDRTTPLYSFLGYGESQPRAINGAGQVVGYGGVGWFRYDDGAVTTLDLPALDINDRGWIVGRDRLLIGGVVHGIAGLLRPADQARVGYLGLELVNDAGQLAGLANVDGQGAAVLLTPVPEPRAWALALAGLCGLGLVLRRCPTRPQAGVGHRSQL
ncbi:DUF3466 family protein [Azohydromonas aeria]|uniref:DUF3466 family protein n=1 Tax=Azohydromonas aeria TaxID=2590212 RepID=UPI0012F721CB|nr:DUF3466 family protein [Azohydromonas aeria]